MEEIRNNLEVVINALNNVEVKGFQNMSNLAGCINILRQIVSSVDNIQSDEEE